MAALLGLFQKTETQLGVEFPLRPCVCGSSDSRVGSGNATIGLNLVVARYRNFLSHPKKVASLWLRSVW